MIYRTVQAQFGAESPDNLIPKIIDPTRVTVFLDFLDSEICRDKLRKVIAFPEACADKLPLLKKTRLHLPKVDLEKLPNKYVFHDLDDLISNFKMIIE